MSWNYLIYLGTRTWRGAGLSPAVAPDSRAGDGWRMLARGFLLQTANPKALLVFSALLPQFIDARAAIAPQVVILAMTSLAIEFVVLAAYGYSAGRAAHLAPDRRFVTAVNRASGGMLVAAGTVVALNNQ